jgi:Zn-dependent M28 family amino/carboxypeptidase
MGSPAAQEAERYLVAVLRSYGLETEVQATTSCSVAAGLARCGHVRNEVARRRGTGSGSSLMLSAHYDSVPNSPGAADDAAGVATLLETARALAADAPLPNDVLFLFSDGEEQMLLGATAFVEQQPWFQTVRVALNFEARGTSGPSALFEASEDGGMLIEAFGDAVPRPIGSSLV